jgi:hypothetical protein
LGYAEGNLLKYGVENSELITKKAHFLNALERFFAVILPTFLI